MRLSIVTSALVASLVGFGSTIAIIIAAAQAVGATPAQTSSWVAGLCLAMMATSAFLSVRHRLPIITAWSTPGAALIAATSGLTIESAVGAFLLAGGLILVTAAFVAVGLWLRDLILLLASGAPGGELGTTLALYAPLQGIITAAAGAIVLFAARQFFDLRVDA